MPNSTFLPPPSPSPPSAPETGNIAFHYDHATMISTPYAPTTPQQVDHYFNIENYFNNNIPQISEFELSHYDIHHLDLEVEQSITTDNMFEYSSSNNNNSSCLTPFESPQSLFTTTQEMASTGSSSASSDGMPMEIPMQAHECKSVVAIRTRTELETLDDGYKWRKYGKKMVKANPNPRHYYKCSIGGCKVKKRVERDGEDSRYLVTTYDGKHNHESPCVVYCDRLPFLMLRPSQQLP